MNDRENEVRDFYAAINQRVEQTSPLDLLVAVGAVDSQWDGKPIPCPICGGKDRFHFNKHKGNVGAFGCRGCNPKTFYLNTSKFISDYLGSNKEANDFFADYFGITNPFADKLNPRPRRILPTPPPPVTAEKKTKSRATYIKRLWGESKPGHQLLINYLKSRGVLPPDRLPDNLRLHEHLKHSDSGEFFPVMTAWFENPHGWSALHRTFLQADGRGKAPVSSAKKILGQDDQWGDGIACQLYPATDILGVAEGIESALAVHKDYPQLPVWACYNDRQLSLSYLLIFKLIDIGLINIRKLFILADTDQPTESKPEGAGMFAARALYRVITEERPKIAVEIVQPSPTDVHMWSKATGGNPRKCDFADIAEWHQYNKRKAA
jgi:putative DNA primase/helicase